MTDKNNCLFGKEEIMKNKRHIISVAAILSISLLFACIPTGTEVFAKDEIEYVSVGESDVKAVVHASETRVLRDAQKEDHDYPLTSMFYGTYIEVENEQPYYVGKEDSSFLKKNKGKYDEVLYLTDKIYLEKGEYNISDETVAKIEDGFLIPLKQGLFTLTKKGDKKTKEVKTTYAVTTFNDNKDSKTAQNFSPNDFEAWQYIYDAETWKQVIRTIPDMINYIMAKNISYTYTEPIGGWFGNGWIWCTSGEHINYYGQGVCATIAQLACYMLAGDFEDWGNIQIGGAPGHIYNWFYEDGSYYVMDFTEVISYNSHGDMTQRNWQYEFPDATKWQDKIYKYDSFESMKKDIVKRTNLERIYCIHSTSCMGHDYYNLVYNPTCSLSCDDVMNKIINGKTETTIYYEKCLEGNVDVIYASGDNVKLGFYEEEDVPMALRCEETTCYSGKRYIRIR